MSISIFLSRPQPINEDQQAFVDKLSSFLESRGLKPRTLGATDYSDQAPLQKVRSLMVECSGSISVAFRRSYVKTGTRTIRKGRKYHRQLIDESWLTSPWAHIEPAMAYQIGLPILILKEAGVVEEGVLERGVIGMYMPEFNLEDNSEDDHYLHSEEWAQISKQWEARVKDFHQGKRVQVPRAKDAPEREERVSSLDTLSTRYELYPLPALYLDPDSPRARYDDRYPLSEVSLGRDSPRARYDGRYPLPEVYLGRDSPRARYGDRYPPPARYPVPDPPSTRYHSPYESERAIDIDVEMREREERELRERGEREERELRERGEKEERELMERVEREGGELMEGVDGGS